MSEQSPLSLGTEDIKKLLMRYAVPAIVAMTAASLYNMMDSIFIGHGVGALGIAGLAVTFPFINLAAAFGSLVGVGASTLVSVKMGQKDLKSAEAVLGNVLLLNTVIGFLFMTVCLIFLDPILYFFGASADTLPYARDYMKVILYGNLITHIYMGLNEVMRASGYPQRAMMATLFAVLINGVLNALFIFVLDMGIKGAAIASVLAEASSILFFLIYTYISVDLKKYGLNRLRSFDPALLMRILSISCFTMLQYFLSMATWFVFFVAVERLGQRELAIANIVRSIYVVLLIPVNALATTTNSLVSNAIGAGGIQYVMPLINKIARFSFFIMLGLVGLSVLFPQFLLSVYTSEAALITESVPSVYVICCAMLIASIPR